MHFRHHYGPAFIHLAENFRRGGFGPFGRGPGGMRGGGGMPFGRLFRDGDLRLVVLALIEEGPRHGYDLIKELEQRSGGFYSPSPGVVYPTLTFLEEAGYVASAADGNKKVYSITDAGRAFLNDNREQVTTIFRTVDEFVAKMSRAREWFTKDGDRGHVEREEVREEPMTGAMGDLERARRRLRALIVAATEGTEADQKRVAEILERASDSILGQNAPTT